MDNVDLFYVISNIMETFFPISIVIGVNGGQTGQRGKSKK
jgi:hypothetical protein